MGATAVEKILARAAGRESVRVGEVIYPEPDLIVMHDRHAHIFLRELWEMGLRALWKPERVMVVIDHRVPPATPALAALHNEIREWCRRFRVGHFFDVGDGGISHQLQIERGLARPGTLLVTKDIHSPNAGAVGALAVPLVYDVPAFLALGSFWVRVPEVLRIRLEGTPPPGVYVRDIAQASTAQIGHERADYRVIEYAGEYVDRIGIDARQTLCNVVIEVGAKSAFLNPDEKACEYMRARTDASFSPVRDDPDAEYALEIDLDLSTLEPQVAAPPSPDNVLPLSEVAGKPIHQAYIGSCASGMMEDLRIAASILEGQRVASGVRAIIVPSTDRIFREAAREGLVETFLKAGAVMHPPGCAPCTGAAALIADGERTICTGTRNEPGRMGSYEAEIYLANPAAVAASAVTGVITDPREFLV